jgi:predicted RNA binding protein YcfA (HicA-like mRNA interferase family)
MSRLPQVSARQMLAALHRAGFSTRRVKGSHHYLVHDNDPTRRTTVAVHSGDLPARDVQDILKQAKLSRSEFLDLL